MTEQTQDSKKIEEATIREVVSLPAEQVLSGAAFSSEHHRASFRISVLKDLLGSSSNALGSLVSIEVDKLNKIGRQAASRFGIPFTRALNKETVVSHVASKLAATLSLVEIVMLGERLAEPGVSSAIIKLDQAMTLSPEMEEHQMNRKLLEAFSRLGPIVQAGVAAQVPPEAQQSLIERFFADRDEDTEKENFLVTRIKPDAVQEEKKRLADGARMLVGVISRLQYHRNTEDGGNSTHVSEDGTPVTFISVPNLLEVDSREGKEVYQFLVADSLSEEEMSLLVKLFYDRDFSDVYDAVRTSLANLSHKLQNLIVASSVNSMRQTAE